MERSANNQSADRITFTIAAEGEDPIEFSFPQSTFMALPTGERASYVGTLKACVQSIRAGLAPEQEAIEKLLSLDGASLAILTGDTGYRATGFGHGMALGEGYNTA